MATVPAPVEKWEGFKYIPDHVMVKFTDEATADDRSALVNATGASIETYWPEMNIAVVNLPDVPGQDNVVPMAQWFQAQDKVVFAEPDFDVAEMQRVPNDPRFNEMWGLVNTGQVGIADTASGLMVPGTRDADIDADLAWDVSTGGRETVVAIIDSGIDYFHPDLRANMWRNPGEVFDGIDNDNNGYKDDVYGYDFADRDSDPMDDSIGHGTHVAGTVAAVGNNGVGVTGVSWNTKLMALKTFGTTSALSGFAGAIRYTGMMRQNFHINIVASNNSWGLPSYAPILSSSLYEAIKYATDAGVSFVAAAGNDALNMDIENVFGTASEYNIQGLIAVAATNRLDQLSDFSNWGPGTVDLGAPGTDILSTWPTALASPSPTRTPTGYGIIDGTSMASPHVAGAVAVLRSIAPQLTPAETKAVLMNTVDKLDSLQDRVVSNGRMNLNSAIAALPQVVLSGSLWNDANGDQTRQSTESPLTGFTVYLDANNNGLLDSGEQTKTTDGVGAYSFNIFTGAGTYRVRAISPTGWRQTFPANGGGYTVTAATNDQDFANLNFGLRQLPGSITGRKIDDTNGNGALDQGESGVGGFVIYVDYNNNGVLNSNEPRATTNSNGDYTISNVPPSNGYVLREVPQPGWQSTVIDPIGGAGAVSGVSVIQATNTPTVNFYNTRSVDYGDLPLPYPVTFAENGPRHGVLTGFQLGVTATDGEADGVHSDPGSADKDDTTATADEDGLVISSIFPGQPVDARVTVRTGGNAAGYLQLWIDFNGNGAFETGEQVVRNLKLGNVTDFALPNIFAPANTNVTDPIYARARYGYEFDLGPTGPSYAGEVEDYRLTVLSSVPIARPDSYVFRAGSTFADNPMDVLANDSGSFRGGPYLVAAGLPAGGVTNLGGQVRINDNGTTTDLTDDFLEYQPPAVITPGSLNDYFDYSASDGTNLSAPARVSIRILPLEVVAVDNTFTMFVNQTRQLNVLANDISFGAMTIIGITPATSSVGTISIVNGGTALSFNSNSNTGIAQFTYTVTDDPTDATRSKTAEVTVQVNQPTVRADGTTTRAGVKAELEVVPLDDLGNPITGALVPGQRFWAAVVTRDPRTAFAFSGVQAAYTDLLFDRTVFTPVQISTNGNVIVNHNDFGTPQVPVYNALQQPRDIVGATNIDGLIDDAGGFYEIASDPTGPTASRYPQLFNYDPATGQFKYLLFRVQLQVNNVPTQITPLTLDPADLPAANPNNVLVIDNNTLNPIKLTLNDVNFIEKSIQVNGGTPGAGGEGEFTNLLLPQDVNNDYSVDAADALALIYEYDQARGRSELWQLQPGMYGRQTPMLGQVDVNQDGMLAADDILYVVYYMDAHARSGNGEGEAPARSSAGASGGYASAVDALFGDENA